jgi:hypothetical protein
MTIAEQEWKVRSGIPVDTGKTWHFGIDIVPQEGAAPFVGEIRIFIGAKSDNAVSESAMPAPAGGNRLLRDIYLLSETGQDRRAIDLLFDHFNRWMRKDKWAKCDSVLWAADIKSLSSTLMVAFLSVTLTTKGKFQARPGFFTRVKARLTQDRGPERAAKLLDKYL